MVKQMEVFGTILRDSRGRCVLVKGLKSEKWSFPKGHPNENESELDCALRETYEETGLQLDPNGFEQSVRLSCGKYFVYTIQDDSVMKPVDTEEIQQISWFTVPEMKQLKVNVDISHFLRHKMYWTRWVRNDQPTKQSKFEQSWRESMLVD